MPRGGPRTPAQPSPVSGPGALSRRTDGGAGQPVRLAPGGAYGERQQMEELQQSAPMAAGSPALGGGGGPAGGGGGQPPNPADIFAPTGRPGEPITAGAMGGPGQGPQHIVGPNPEESLLALYQARPSPELLRILQLGHEA